MLNSKGKHDSPKQPWLILDKFDNFEVPPSLSTLNRLFFQIHVFPIQKWWLNKKHIPCNQTLGNVGWLRCSNICGKNNTMKVDHVPRKIMCFPHVLYVYLGVTNGNRLGLYSSRSPSQIFLEKAPARMTKSRAEARWWTWVSKRLAVENIAFLVATAEWWVSLSKWLANGVKMLCEIGL